MNQETNKEIREVVSEGEKIINVDYLQKLNSNCEKMLSLVEKMTKQELEDLKSKLEIKLCKLNNLKKINTPIANPVLSNSFDEIVKSLKEDAINLQNKFSKFQEENNIKGSLDVLRLLKDTLNLIKEYDWKLMYSEYEARQNPNEDFHKEVTVWEQNSEGNIRNHKVWLVKDTPLLNINNKFKVYNDGSRITDKNIKPEDIIDEISNQFNKLSDNDKDVLLEILGGIKNKAELKVCLENINS